MTAQVIQERSLSPLQTARWNEPAGLKPRGTVFLLTGRGETPEVYGRFASRLAADAYRVAIHGAADSLSPLDLALAFSREAGVPEVVVVDEGLHDILNDLSHRSVAASIVLFLERLRRGSAQEALLVATPTSLGWVTG